MEHHGFAQHETPAWLLEGFWRQNLNNLKPIEKPEAGAFWRLWNFTGPHVPRSTFGENNNSSQNISHKASRSLVVHALKYSHDLYPQLASTWMFLHAYVWGKKMWHQVVRYGSTCQENNLFVSTRESIRNKAAVDEMSLVCTACSDGSCHGNWPATPHCFFAKKATQILFLPLFFLWKRIFRRKHLFSWRW